MKRHFKNWRRLAVALLVLTFGAFVSVGLSWAVTSNSNNNAPAQAVTLNETDFLVMDFNINVASDYTVAGASTAGVSVSATEDADWNGGGASTDFYFYDRFNGGAWDSGNDWLGFDNDSNGYYTAYPDAIVDCDGTATVGAGSCSLSIGTALVEVEAADNICTDSLSSPTCIYLTSGTCGEDGGDTMGHDTNVILGSSACDSGVDVLVTAASNWSFDDGGSISYTNGETLVIEGGVKNLSYNLADTTVAGVAPTQGTAINDAKDADWTTLKFYDAAAGGAWNAGADWIGVDVDGDNYFLDRLNALTADLAEASTINALSDVTNVKFWLDNGNGSFSTGTDTLLGTAATASAYDSGGSGWYITGLNRALSAGANRIFVSMTLNAAASHGELIKLSVPQYVDNGSDGVWQLGDRGMFLNSRVLGNVVNTNLMTVDAVAPTLTINIDESEFAVGDTADVTFTFSEEVTGFTTGDITVNGGALSGFTTTDNVVWTATFTPTNGTSYLNNQRISVSMPGLNDVAGNAGSGTTYSSTYSIDTLRPSLSSAVFSDDKLKIGDTSTVTFTFSEEVAGFTNADLSVVNGTLTDVATADSGLTWTATFTPSASIEDLSNVITVDMTGVEDKKLSSKANTGTGTTDSSNYEIDTVAPTLNITMSDYSLIIGETATVTFTFSEAVDLADDDITVGSGTLSAIATADGGLTYTATFTPAVTTEDATNVVTVDMSEVKDKRLVTDWNIGGDDVESANYAVDTIRATFNMQYYSDLALTAVIANNAYLKAGTYYLKISASEALGATPTVTLDAEGSANDVTNAATTHLTGNDYLYTRVIATDVDAVGVGLENVSVSGADAAGNVSADYNPVNEGVKAIYTDTVAPSVDAGADRGTVRAEFTQQGVASDSSNDGVVSYLWEKASGYYNVSFGTATADGTTVNVIGGGPYTIKLTVSDRAGNTAEDDFTFTWGSVPGGSGSSRGGVGSGSIDISVNNNNNNINIGLVNKQGVNFLSYINSKGSFQTMASRIKALSSHYITINDLDLLNNIVKFTIESEPQTFQMKLNEHILVDLDKDGINDIEVEFAEIWVNRVELTIKSIYEPVAETVAAVSQSSNNTTLKAGEELRAEVMARELASMKTLSSQLSKRLAGRILLQVEEKGEAWYVEPTSKAKHFMGRPADAFAMMRKFGLGVSNDNFDKFAAEGVPAKFAGRIFIKVEDAGKAYYINPVDLKMHYLGRPDDAFKLMRELALGVSNDNIRQIEIAQ